MLDKKEKRKLRSSLFRHLDGIVTAPTAYLLKERSVLDAILQRKSVELTELAKEFNANEAYLNVALRILASQNWLVQEIDNKSNKVRFSINENSESAFKLSDLYADVIDLIKFSERFHRRKFKKAPFLKLKSIMAKYKEHYGLETAEEGSVEFQVLKHIEGLIVGPTIMSLGMSGMFHKYFLTSSFQAGEFHEDAESFEELLDFFEWLGWFKKHNNNFSFTDTGLFFARRASAYGVTVSYIPTLRHLDELIFGNPLKLRNSEGLSEEKHVDRAMNVWGSGGAHSAYFKKMDKVLIELFNQDIEDQPKGILDMGCGNGAFLIHAYNVIENRTLRGQMLEDHPLFLVGADYNEKALEITRSNIVQNEIWAKVIFGDIGRPEMLAEELKQNYNIELVDLLNVRTFLDHNRIWETVDQADPNYISTSTGAFAFNGHRITNDLVEQNLIRHFERWLPYVHKHGLLLIELHTVDPSIVAKNLGRTAVTAYDGTHGYSDQFILELDIFKEMARRAGFEFDDRYAYRFPDSELASVSINLMRGKR
jgi:SAM-dependent methyltransferase